MPLNEYCLVQLPVCLKSTKLLKRVIGNEEEFISSCKQDSDVRISLYPNNPYIGNIPMHKKGSNKLILKMVKDGDSLTGEIVGKVKSEYVATNLMDFMYLPEKQFYDVCDDGIVPHFDCFQGSSEPESLYILPIRMTPYGVPFDINMHDSILEKERTIEKDHIFVSSEAETPLAPRSSLPGITEESPLYEYLQTVRSLLQRQPVWDKQYLLLRVAHTYPSQPVETVRNNVYLVVPYLCYVLTDGPFRNCWVRFGFNPSKEQSSWIYQYVEFRFSKRPRLLDGSSSEVLPCLYEIPLNLHNKYPLCELQVDREMNKLISSMKPNSVYQKRSGWLSPDYPTRIRSLLKKQAILLLSRNGYDTQTVGK